MSQTPALLKVFFTVCAVLFLSGVNGKSPPDEKLLIPFQYLRVTTNTVYNIVSSTVYPYCITGTFAVDALCGKRRRRSLPINTDLIENDSQFEVEGSQNRAATKEDSTSADREKFFKFTIWNTSSFTTSITLLYTYPGASISLSYLCFAPQMSLPPLCG